MPLSDLQDFLETAFPAPAGTKTLVPSPGAKVFDLPFRTANGYFVQVNQSGSKPFPAQVLQWVEDAFNACGYDVARLWAIKPLHTRDIDNSGEPSEMRFIIRGADSSTIPNFPNDYVSVDNFGTVAFSQVTFNIWDGLVTAPSPFGGRRFFMETILHAIGHVVGSYLAAGFDPFKRERLCYALAKERIIDEYGRGENDFGPAYAWQMWDDTWNGSPVHSPWDQLPQERFAEAFKDTWGLPSAHIFVNRTKAKYINRQAVIEEAQVFLPINGVDLPPHPAYSAFQGFQMSQVAIPPHSIQDSCSNVGDALQFPCWDPGSGDLKHCVGCDDSASIIKGDTGCSTSYLFPSSEGNFDVRWNVVLKIPRIGFAKDALIAYGGPRCSNALLTRAYTCPGIPGIGARNIGAAVSDKKWDGVITDGPNLQIRVQRGPTLDIEGLPGNFVDIWQWGFTDFTLDLRAHTTPSQFFTGVGYGTLSIIVNGWATMGENDLIPSRSFEFMADPTYVAIGYKYILGNETRIYAPSDGITFNPYSELNLDGVLQGAARAPDSLGVEAVVADLDTSTTGGRDFSPDTLTIEGG